jgi:hypothetical protein
MKLSLTIRRAVVAVLLLVLPSCALLTSATSPKGVLAATQIACILQHAFLDDATLDKVCDLLTVEQRLAARAVAISYREQAKVDAVMRPALCAPLLDLQSHADAGPDGSR